MFSVLVGIAIAACWQWLDASLDIDVYWEAATRMRAGGDALYAKSSDAKNSVGVFIYPPFFAALFAPLTWLPRGAGYVVWCVIQVGLVFGGLWFAARLALAAFDRDRWGAMTLMLMATFGAQWMTLVEGQVNMLLVLFIAAGLFATLRGREVSGGFLLACAAHLKVLPVILLPYLLIRKQFKAAGAMVGGLVLLVLLPCLWTVPNKGVVDGVGASVNLHIEYVESVAASRVKSQDASGLGGPRAPNNSLSSVTQRYFGEGKRLSMHAQDLSPLIATAPTVIQKWLGPALALALLAASLALAWRRRDDDRRWAVACGLGLLAAGLGNVLFWPHHLCLLAIVIGPLWGIQKRTARALALVAVVLCYVPLLDRIEVFDWMAILGAPTLGVLTIWVVSFVASWKPAPILPHHEQETQGTPAA